MIAIVLDDMVQVVGMRSPRIVPIDIGVPMKASQRDRKERRTAECKNVFRQTSHSRTIYQKYPGALNLLYGFCPATTGGCTSVLELPQ